MNFNGTLSPKIQSWQQANWPQNAKHWTEFELNKKHFRLIGELQQVKGWTLGYVLRQTTYSGDVFFKATAFLPLFSNEASLCAKLYELFPQYSAEVIAFDASQQWMLTASFGEVFVDTVPLSDWAEPFAAFAKLQITSVKHITELESAGCIRRDITNLPKQLRNIFQNEAITSRLPKELNLSADKLNHVIERLISAVAALSAFKIPNTLVHSDLHIENIAPAKSRPQKLNYGDAPKDEGFVFFDWSDGCISHPFIDGTYLFRMDDSEDKQYVIDTYLSQWREYGSRDELLQAWQLAEFICYAHQAVSYAGMLHILTQEQTPDLVIAFENAFRRFLNKAMN